MKKLTIFRKNLIGGKNIVLRAVCVHPQFIGNGKWGRIIAAEFTKLAQDLEPTSTGWSLADL